MDYTPHRGDLSHGAIDDCLYIAAQYVSGGDLGDRIQQQGPLAPLDALTVAAQVASALAAAHQVGVLHRDVKPRNVLLRPAGDGLHAYLCDFGIAAGQDAQLTATGVVAGTFGYLAPDAAEAGPPSPALRPLFARLSVVELPDRFAAL